MTQRRQQDFPDTFLPGVARAADRAMKEALEETAAIDGFLEVPAGLRPTRARRSR